MSAARLAWMIAGPMSDAIDEAVRRPSWALLDVSVALGALRLIAHMRTLAGSDPPLDIAAGLFFLVMAISSRAIGLSARTAAAAADHEMSRRSDLAHPPTSLAGRSARLVAALASQPFVAPDELYVFASGSYTHHTILYARARGAPGGYTSKVALIMHESEYARY